MGIFGEPNIEKLKARKNVKGLIEALKYKDQYVRGGAAEALGEIGDKRAVEPLTNALKDPFSHVRYYAARALGKIGDSRAVEPLIEALRDNDYEVRRNAALALGEIGDKRAVEPLTKALKDKDSGVRMRAAETLVMIAWQPKDDVEKAYYLIAKKQWDELVKLGEPAVGPLIEALNDEYWYVDTLESFTLRKIGRSDAARALGEIKDRRAVKPLKQALNDEDESIRKAAQEALEKIKKT